MPEATRELQNRLMASHPEFQRLAEEHSKYESLLEAMAKEPYLNAETLNELAHIKKMKLRLKDEMQRILAEHARQQH